MANTIIRAHQRTVDDGRLSWAARGMLAYLLSRPGNWQVRVKDLQRRGHMGRDGTYKLINELCSAGYMEFQQVGTSGVASGAGLTLFVKSPIHHIRILRIRKRPNRRHRTR